MLFDGDSTCLHLSSRLPSPGREATVLGRLEKSSPAQLWRVWGCGGREMAIGQKKSRRENKKMKQITTKVTNKETMKFKRNEKGRAFWEKLEVALKLRHHPALLPYGRRSSWARWSRWWCARRRGASRWSWRSRPGPSGGQVPRCSAGWPPSPSGWASASDPRWNASGCWTAAHTGRTLCGEPGKTKRVSAGKRHFNSPVSALLILPGASFEHYWEDAERKSSL